MDKHPVSETKYSFLTFDSAVKLISNFQTKFSSESQVKTVIEDITPRIGVNSRLDLALKTAEQLLANSRKSSKKAVVIYTDKEPTGDAEGIAAGGTAKALEDQGIQIIVVLLNMSSVPETVGKITPNKKSVIPATGGKDAKNVVKKIGEVLKGGIDI